MRSDRPHRFRLIGHAGAVHRGATMAIPPYVEGGGATGQRRPPVDAARLWTGGLATAVVAALIAVVGVVIARGLFDVPVLAPEREGVLGDSTTVRLAVLAAAAALVATGLMHLLLLSTPRPFRFFTWIVSLLTLLAVLGPVHDRRHPRHPGRHRRHRPGDRDGDRLAGPRGGQERDPARQAGPTVTRALESDQRSRHGSAAIVMSSAAAASRRAPSPAITTTRPAFTDTPWRPIPQARRP